MKSLKLKTFISELLGTFILVLIILGGESKISGVGSVFSLKKFINFFFFKFK